MNEFKADLAVLQGWAARLSDASNELAGAGDGAPDPPNAGRCTALVAAALSQLCTGLGVMTDGLANAGHAVTDGGTTYHQADGGAADHLGGH